MSLKTEVNVRTIRVFRKVMKNLRASVEQYREKNISVLQFDLKSRSNAGKKLACDEEFGKKVRDEIQQTKGLTVVSPTHVNFS